MIWRRAVRALPALLAVLAACAPRPRASARPEAEFLLVTDDSTAWVHSAADTVIVRRAPLLVATLDDRLIEIYVAEEAIDFENATFLGNRVFRRDLVTGDSTLVFADSTVLREVRSYVQAHPDAERLDDDEPASPDARSVEADIMPMEVLGPTLGLEVHVDKAFGDGGTHDTYRATVDLRTGRRVSLHDVVPDVVAAMALARAQQHLSAAIVLAARRAGPLGKAASRAMAQLPFDSMSFTLTHAGDSLAAQFLAHDEQVIDETRDSHRYAIEPVGVQAPAWWASARGSLPRTMPDSSTRVDLGTLSLDVRSDSNDVAAIAVRTSGGRRAVTTMRGPLRRVIAVGDSLIAPRDRWRRALERAFSESGYYSDAVRAASLRNRARTTSIWQAAL